MKSEHEIKLGDEWEFATIVHELDRAEDGFQCFLLSEQLLKLGKKFGLSEESTKRTVMICQYLLQEERSRL